MLSAISGKLEVIINYHELKLFPQCGSSHELKVSGGSSVRLLHYWLTSLAAPSDPANAAAAPACLSVTLAAVLTFTPLLAVRPEPVCCTLCKHTAACRIKHTEDKTRERRHHVKTEKSAEDCSTLFCSDLQSEVAAGNQI